MPIVNIQILKGRSLEQKKNLTKAVTDAIVSTIGVKPEVVWIVIEEMEKENFATGGKLHSEK
ncbi:MAG: 2-hydroxymuconate tautomerase family protein [Candidatus Firestonebacteria bacterium]|nr:2-hydroxymuconate tautomerase family protein [Candidatus Firestonebacteria bacterium]